jgi:predicted metal-dependent peptidase
MSKAADKGKNTTGEGTVVGSRKDLTPEQKRKNDQHDLGTNMLDLFWKEPFYARIYNHINRIKTRDIPTAGVGVKDSSPTLYWNPDFVAELTGAQVRGLLMHEAYHLIYSHVTIRRYNPHWVWNWACDLAINCSIPLDHLPKGGLNPGHAFEPLTDERIKQLDMSPEDVQRYQHLSQLIASFPAFKSAEWYYTQLMQDSQIKDDIQKGEAIKEFLKKMAEAMGNGQDVHDAWDDMPDGQRDLIDGKIRAALEEAVSHADNTNSWGSVPGEAREALRALVTHEVNWKQVLRSFVGRSRRANSKNSIKKINRKQPYIFPGRSRSYTANVWIYVDESGSVGNSDLQLLFGELNNLAKLVTFRLIPFTAAVHEENAFTWKKGQKKPEVIRTNSGGTSFDAVVEHANKHKDQHDGVGWVIVPPPSGHMLFAPKRGEVVIKLKNEEKEAA